MSIFKQIILPIIVFMLLPILFTTCGKSNVKQPDSTFHFTSFRDIPSVTEEEIKAIEALQGQYDCFSYAMISSSEAFYNDDGSVGGFSALFCKWLTKLFDIPFIPEFSDFDHLIAGLARNEIDFTGSLTPTEARRKIFSMTTPIALQTMQYFRIEGSLPLEVIAASRPLRYSFMRGTATINLVTPKLAGAYELVFAADIDDVYRMLKSGDVDAHFDSSREIAFDIYGDVISTNFNPLIYTSASMMTQNPDLSPIISIVQKAMDNGALQYLAELHNAGHQEYLKHKLSLRLNEEEREYIRKHPVVPFAASAVNYPVSFYNEREKQWQGVSFDIFKEVESLTGLNFKLVTDVNARLVEIFKLFEDGEASMMTELVYSTERAENFIWSKTTLMTDYPALISRLDYRNISLNEVLYTNVGLIRGYAQTGMFWEWFPDHYYTNEYPNIETAFDALDKGEVDVVMARTRDLLFLTNYLERTNFKTNYVFGDPINLSFAFSRNEVILCSIIDKALRLIDTGRIADQWTNRSYDYNRKLVNTQRFWFIGSSVLFLSALTLVTVLLFRNRRAGRQLKSQSEAVFAASRAKGIFLAHMSHEIRTPLNAIIGMSYILKDCVEDNEKALRSVNQVITSSHHLLGILNDILDMSKIESGKLELNREPFSLLTACGEVSDIMTQRCVEKNITFITNIHDLKDITIMGDKLRLNQVLINLLGNAVKFTNENGEIKFITEITDLIHEENSSVIQEKAQVKFSVSDNGIGMSEEQIQKLFIPFEQTDSTIAARFGGTGLGLSLSQNFINMMGGTISVSSEPDKGSRFEFSLCFEKSELPVPEASDEKYENVNLKGKRILLAEDIEINRLIVCELLSSADPEIDEAANGRQAVDLFINSPEGYYDIIMMDIQMPVLDGYEAVKEIRVLDRADAKTVPIIAMTAHAYKEDVEQALAVGMNGHLAKPINKPTLMETVRKIIKDREG